MLFRITNIPAARNHTEGCVSVHFDAAINRALCEEAQAAKALSIDPNWVVIIESRREFSLRTRGLAVASPRSPLREKHPAFGVFRVWEVVKYNEPRQLQWPTATNSKQQRQR